MNHRHSCGSNFELFHINFDAFPVSVPSVSSVPSVPCSVLAYERGDWTPVGEFPLTQTLGTFLQQLTETNRFIFRLFSPCVEKPLRLRIAPPPHLGKKR